MKQCLLLLICTFMLSCRWSVKQTELLVYVPGGGEKAARIEELLQELGIQAHVLSKVRDLIALKPSDFRHTKAMVCFEGDQELILGKTAFDAVLQEGGTLLLVGDSAKSLETRLGIKVHLSDEHHWVWQERALPFLQPGTYEPQDGTAVVYKYGPKVMTGWYYEKVDGEVWANDYQGHPRWVEINSGKGKVVLAGLPLATHAVNGDSLGARLLLERAADFASIPRLWPTPKGLGGMVVNLHVDSSGHIQYLPILSKRWPPSVRASVHITAGPDCNKEGDREGFDVLNPTKGGLWISRLRAMGDIGSHGGWAHNLWGSQANRWPFKKKEEWTAKNFEALQPFGPIRSYSGPDGIHPIELNPWLESHGIIAYYHTGESGSPPTHAWLRGKPFSHTMWAFPVATDGDAAAAPEWKSTGKGEEGAMIWGLNLVNWCRDHRSLRLIYGHPLEWTDLPYAYFGWLEHFGKEVAEGRMTSRTMAEYAEFLCRRAQVRWRFQRDKNTASIFAEGPSLRDIAFRIPGHWTCQEPGMTVNYEEGWTWIILEDDRTQWKGRLNS